MVHRDTPHSKTKYSPYYLLHARDMRLPDMDDLSACMEAYGNDRANQNYVSSHIDALADKFGEAY
jgi:hypothetical protein